MKVLHLIYTHGIAGAEKYLKHLLPPLREYNIESHLVLVVPPVYSEKVATYCKEMNALGIPVTVLEYSKKDFFKASKRIALYTKEHGIGYLHSHLVNSDVLAILAKKIYNRSLTLISTKHGYSEYILKQVDDVSKSGRLRLKAMSKAYYYITWLTLKMIPNNFAVSKAMAILYQNLGFTGKEMPFIHHGVNVTGSNEPVMEKNPGPTLLIIGRLEIFKGHICLIKAMPAIVSRFPSCKLIVLGEGGERQNFENLAQSLGVAENVQFMGFHNNPYAFIRQADVVVIPSLFEPFGLVFIEAIALQKAVAAFDVPAGNEILTHGKTALLAPRADHDALAQHIICLLNDKELSSRLGAAGYAHYLNNFTTATMVKNTFNYYNGIKKS
ncbi:MAG: glycosyltransferase [Ferruginibacter sp.]